MPAGATGRLKPKGGPEVAFVVERLVPGREFVDISRLLGDRLTVDHQVTPLPDGGCRLEERGLVRRALDPSDKRARAVTVTDEGAALANRLATLCPSQTGAPQPSR